MSDNNPFTYFKKKINGMRPRSKFQGANKLGVISRDHEEDSKLYRDKRLELYDSYYENRQYDSMPDWDQIIDSSGNHIPVRQRKPRLRIPFAKTLSQRVTAKVIGQRVFPTFVIPDNPEDQELIKAVIRETHLKTNLTEPFRKMLNTGTAFLRFYLSGGVMKFENYDAKYCYPTFQDNGELEILMVRYVYTDKEERDKNGNFKRKWFKQEFNTMSEILFDNPDYVANEEPVFVEVERVDHNFGFVQGEWMRTTESGTDGYGLVADIMDFIDEMNYSLSQSSQAVGYNQDPQLLLKGMDEDGLNTLIRSAYKSWNMGLKGEADFLESNLTGVEKAMELRDKVKLNIQDITRILLLDPEKIVGSAQSAKAMEVLHGPLVELVDELRLPVEKMLKSLVLKMTLAILMASKQGMDTPVIIPPGYEPQSLALELDWPPIFQQTMEDLDKKVSVASRAKTTGLISPETATRWISKDFNVENVEEELAKIDEAAKAAAALNPFGGF